MKPYQKARDIFYNAQLGQEFKFSKKEFPKVQQSLNVVKRRHITTARFKSSKKTLTIKRVL